jgi:hypothetical protein
MESSKNNADIQVLKLFHFLLGQHCGWNDFRLYRRPGMDNGGELVEMALGMISQAASKKGASRGSKQCICDQHQITILSSHIEKPTSVVRMRQMEQPFHPPLTTIMTARQP